MLLEVILTVVIFSICMAFIIQSLWINFRVGVRFSLCVRSLIAMENRLGILYATQGSSELLSATPQALDKPYDQFKISTDSRPINDHLRWVYLTLHGPAGHHQRPWEMATIIYSTHVSS